MLDPAIQKTFDQQRYERLKEIVSEYIDDEGQSSQKFLDDIERAVLENSQYFQGRLDAYLHIQGFFK